GSYHNTEIGTIAIDASSASDMSLSVIDPQNPYQGVALSLDGAWITCNLENLIWLPSEYRPLHSAVLGNKISKGVRTGKEWICYVKGKDY
ncbi:uncharacterized protein K441DRAFT_568507, partial [Cenococcum geophilum 1.58]|uniref:uncharacterized protein n=1 Tax=Cenococcum geophilum 1.58 TaxID=794803 RepID=UPI00358EC6A2